MLTRTPRWRRAVHAAIALIIAATLACVNGPAVLTQHTEARQLAARLHIQFVQANEAANRAVMADTDEASSSAADVSRQVSASAEQTLQQLQPLLASLGYKDEIGALSQFALKFGEYKTLDAEILPLAVENTNLKAQRLSFGSGQEAADAVFAALAAATAGTPKSADATAESAVCRASVLAIQVIQARHIAEPDEKAMTDMEAQMTLSEQAAREALGRLRAFRPAAGQSLTDASAALDRFMTVNRQIVELSRRNSNVRSLALTLGRKRVVAAECEDQLQALEDALAKHAFAATR